MKFLTDENIGLEVVEFLRDKDNDVVSIMEGFSSSPDTFVLKKALDEDRILITSDKDFGLLIYVKRLPHKGVIFLRLTDERNEAKIKVISQVLTNYGKRLKGNFVVVTETKVRFRK